MQVNGGRQVDYTDTSYADSDGKNLLTLAGEVLGYVAAKRQKGCSAREVGGQLFADFNSGNVIVRVATGPYECDRKSLFGFIPSLLRERRDIARLYKAGLHYVGNWHTHPQAIPKPSRRDIETMEDYFAKSKHELNYFVMVIVGTGEFPESIWASLHNKKGYKRLTASGSG